MKLDRRSLILLAIQLAIVSSIAAKYLYQRNTCPRVWTQARAYDPELILRGRYLSMQLLVDACGVTLPPVTTTPATAGDNAGPTLFAEQRGPTPFLGAKLGTKQGKLVVSHVDEWESDETLQRVQVQKRDGCSKAILVEGVDFYIPEHAISPLGPGKQIWVEVTVPPKGPPRPLNLAVNDNGKWQPLQF